MQEYIVYLESLMKLEPVLAKLNELRKDTQGEGGLEEVALYHSFCFISYEVGAFAGFVEQDTLPSEKKEVEPREAAKDILSYAFYRFECCLRSAAVLSFIGLQGIGYQIMVSLDDVNFGQVWTLLIFLVAMVVLIDHWGSQIRRNLFS